jgi:hypothetical protein
MIPWPLVFFFLLLLLYTKCRNLWIPKTIGRWNESWLYIAHPTHNCSCKSFEYINYNWMEKDSTFIGYETFDSKNVNHWTKQGLYLNNYWSTVDKELPIRFLRSRTANLNLGISTWRPASFEVTLYNLYLIMTILHCYRMNKVILQRKKGRIILLNNLK